MLGRKKRSQEDEADFHEEFRFGFFDESGLVNPMHISNSKEQFEALGIPPETKPFKYPREGGGYDMVYLGCTKKLLSTKYSIDGHWLDAELCYANYELSGSFSGKLTEIYYRVGDIKAGIEDEFSLKANLFVVIMIIIGGVSLFYAFGKYIFH